jgi:hypothetical protein
MSTYPRIPAPGTAGSPPGLSVPQATALLRSAAAISCELMSGAFPTIVEMVRDALALRWDFDVASPMVQRLLTTKDREICAAFNRQLPQFQEMAFDRLLNSRNLLTMPDAFDAEDLALVAHTEGGGDAVAGRAARRMRGLVEEPLRELHLIVEYLSGREQVPQSDNPFGPDVVVPALLQAAIDVDLPDDAWIFFLTAFEADLAGELGRIAVALLDHFRTHGVDARSIRRARAPRAPAPPRARAAAPESGQPGRATGGSAAAGRAGGAPGGFAGAGGGGGAGGAGGADTPAGASGGGAGAFAAGAGVHGFGGFGGGRAGGGAATGSGGSGAGRGGHGAGTGAQGSVAGGADEPVVHGLPGADGDSAGAETSADAALILQELLHRLQGNVAGSVLPPLVAGQGPVAPRLLDALAELQSLGLEGIHGAMFAGTPAGSINAWREHLISQSTRTVDKLTIEIVGMMFDHVLRDSQVPSEIKALLSRLQFPVLKAALLDAAFFASSAHPARRLIDRIAAAAVGWEPYGDENERFRAEVERLVGEVMQKFDRDIALFSRVLDEFEAFLGDVAPRDNDPISRAKRALEEAEKREILTINTTIQVRRAFERVELESWLRDFLVGPWVQVLVAASLRDDQTAGFSKSFREVIHEIVWSVQPKATADDRRRLVELIPALTRIVRDGLALIRMPMQDQEELLQHLMAAHAFAVKPTDQATFIRNAVQTSDLRARIEGLQMTGSFPLTAVPGGIKVPTGAVMRAAAEHDVTLNVPSPVTDVGKLDKVAEARMDQDLSHWSRGTWFELWDGKAFIKARLRWISPLRTMFMFSSGTDNKAHVMSPDLIRSYVRRKFMRSLENVPLTERAAGAVVADFANEPDRATELATRITVIH